MVVIIHWNRWCWRNSRLILRSVEPGHVIVDSALEFDNNQGLVAYRKSIWERYSCTLSWSIIRYASGFEGLLGLRWFHRDFSAMDLKLMSIQDNLLCALSDLGENGDRSLVGEGPAKFEIVDGNAIIDGLNGIRKDISIQACRCHSGERS